MCEANKIPSWIDNQEQCLWCKRYTLEVDDIKVTEKGLLVEYLCSNKQCDRIERFNLQADYKLLYESMVIVKKYQKFLKGEKSDDTRKRTNDSRNCQKDG
jgi:hypothetical protein